jgi:hypothetical protein
MLPPKRMEAENDNVAGSPNVSLAQLPAFPCVLSREQKLHLVKDLALEGITIKEDWISVVQYQNGILLLEVAIRKYRFFNRVRLSYAVSHMGLPFPIIFSRDIDAVQFYCLELARSREPPDRMAVGCDQYNGIH